MRQCFYLQQWQIQSVQRDQFAKVQWLSPEQKNKRTGEADSCDEATEFIASGLDGRLLVWDAVIDPEHVHPNTGALVPGASLVN